MKTGSSWYSGLAAIVIRNNFTSNVQNYIICVQFHPGDVVELTEWNLLCDALCVFSALE